MSYYEDIEKKICELLCPKDEEGKNINTIYEANPLPDNDSGFSRNFDISKVYVFYTGSDFSEDETTNTVVQKETLTFECNVRAKTRHGEKGIFTILDDIRKKIQGYRFPGGTKKTIMGKSSYVDGGTQNDWNYAISFSFKRNAVDCQPDEVGVPATNIEFQ